MQNAAEFVFFETLGAVLNMNIAVERLEFLKFAHKHTYTQIYYIYMHIHMHAYTYTGIYKYIFTINDICGHPSCKPIPFWVSKVNLKQDPTGESFQVDSHVFLMV